MMYRDRTHVPAPPVGFCDQNTYPAAASMATHWEPPQQEMTTSGAAASIVAAVHLINEEKQRDRITHH